MRHNYQITISDCHRARHYTLSQLMLRVGLAAGGVAIVVFFGCLLVIHLLNSRVDTMHLDLAELENRNQAVQEENQRLLQRHQELNRQIDDRASELIALGDDLRQLESIMGIEPPPALPVAERISVASQTAFEKHLMLSSIPSGAPLASATVTSRFGMREHPVIEGTRLHAGIDFRASIGTEVTATADGVVEYAGNNSSSGLGKMIKVVHNYGFSTIYAHLSEIDVRVGDYVTKGQPMGRSGNTGLSNAPHLHYEVLYLGRRLNPAPFIDWSLDQYQTVFDEEDRVQWQSLARTVRNKVQVMEPRSSRQAASLSAISP